MSADLLIFTATFALDDGEDSRILRGLAVPYRQESSPTAFGGHSYRHRFEPGAFARSVRERGGKVRLFVEHDTQRLPIGRAIDYEDTPEGLRVGFEFARTASGDEALQLVRDGYVSGLSVGVDPLRFTEDQQGVLVHSEARLREVSLVNEPAFAGAGFSGGGGNGEPTTVDVERARLRLRLAEKGFIHG
ncbi:HK97 family phage prohead protease [Amycolatopsis taiwanensis]|uniref:Prohead serine protease domain-containing protein n=1 Tax=Amycolatopsis taiwanensis TaxID=342230 RepID=A0A9W6QXD9_9PSEU|nr:HK97 family phage prohead protease [Amycolatopsis taiwanensis]GLY63715.1 hypothetical protein Atai01_03340 [Amycolatopsis taiwanensis]